MAAKVCTKCKKRKTLLNFNKDRGKKDGYASSCKKCNSKDWRTQYYTVKGEKIQKNSSLKYLYNITLKEYDQRFEQQNGVCAICKEPELNRRLAVDHNHQTGKVRGLLCIHCNTLLGNIERHYQKIEKIIKYLEEK